MSDDVEEQNTDPLAELTAGFNEGLENSSRPEEDPLDFSKPDSDATPEPDKSDETTAKDGGDTPAAEETPAKEDTPAEPPVTEAPKAEPPKAAVVPQDEADKLYKLLDQRLPAQPEPKAKEPEPEKPVLSEEEATRLKELTNDYKDVTELFQLQSKQMAAVISKEVARQVAQIKSEFEQQLQPVQSSVQRTAAQQYDDVVKSAHPEVYDAEKSKEFGDALVDWVKNQPAYLRDAYVQAFQSPDAQDAVDLITRFKNETGRAAEAQAEAPASTPVASKSQDTERDKKLRQMVQPDSRQTKVSDSKDPLDFEGGFNEMVREMNRAG